MSALNEIASPAVLPRQSHNGVACQASCACRMGLEGIVSKRLDAPYRSGPSKMGLKSKNPLSEAVRREREERSN